MKTFADVDSVLVEKVSKDLFETGRGKPTPASTLALAPTLFASAAQCTDDLGAVTAAWVNIRLGYEIGLQHARENASAVPTKSSAHVN